MSAMLVLALCLVLSPYVLESASVGDCNVKGVVHAEGSSWKPEPCETCFCNQGQQSCMIADCFVNDCVNPASKPDTCCPVCEQGPNCYAGNKIIPAGKNVKINAHTTCRCPDHSFQMGHNKQAVCNTTAQAHVLP